MDNETRGLKCLLDTADGVDEAVRPPDSSRSNAALPTSQASVSRVADDIKSAPGRRFAGLTYAQLMIGALGLAAVIWSMWATSKIFALEDRRVVSVRLASIVNDFVAAEARSGTPPEQLEARTRDFMTALDSVLKKRADAGQVVLVGEAVIASSVPDVTNDVVSDLSRLVKMPVSVPMPPALPSTTPAPMTPLSGEPAPLAPAPALEPSPGYGSAPSGQPSPPAQMVPQQ